MSRRNQLCAQSQKHRAVRQAPIFELTPLEQRVLLSLSPMIYGAATVSDTPSTAPYTVYFSATGSQASQVTSVKINWGDYVSGAPDIQTYSLPQPPTYPYALPAHTYPKGHGDYPVTATAYINTTSFLPVGLSLDPSFGAIANGAKLGTNTNGANDAGYGVAIDATGSPDGNVNYGKIYVADTASGQLAVMRYNADGTIDTGFGTGGTAYTGVVGTASAVAVDSQGRVVVVGTSSGQFAVARLNTDGSLDRTNFGNNGYVTTAFTGNAQATAVVVQPDGHIVVAGSSNLNVSDTMAVARYNSTGQLDTTFGPNGNGTMTTTIAGAPSDCNALILQTVAGSTDYVLGGTAYMQWCGPSNPGGGDLALARLTSAGNLDGTFGGGGGCAYVNVGCSSMGCYPINGCCATGPSSDAVYSLAEQNDGSIIAAGQTDFLGEEMVIARFTPSGDIDLNYGSGGLAATHAGLAAYGAAIQQDGKVVLAGPYGVSNGAGFGLARYDTDGVLDPTFGNGGTLEAGFNASSAGAKAVAVQGDGHIVAAGYSDNAVAIARLNPDNAVHVGPLASAVAPDLSGPDDGPGDIATGADGGNPGAMSFSGAVRYSDGTVSISDTDIASAQAGWISGQSRTWTDSPGVAISSTNGNNVVVSQWPYLAQETGGALMAVQGGQTLKWFDLNNGTYTERFYGNDSLTSDGNGGYYLTDSTGNSFHYFGFTNTIPTSQQGQLQSLTDPGGNVTTFTWSGGQLQSVSRQAGATVVETMTYSYTNGMLTGVADDRQLNGSGNLVPVQNVVYEYYDGSTNFGRAGDLARATVYENGVAVNHDLYVYDPNSGLMLYAVRGASYEQLAAATNGDPLNNTTAPVAQYANYAFTYYGAGDGWKNGKVKTQSLNSGAYTYHYDYFANTGSVGVEAWCYKTVETLPDANTNTVYTNYAGEVILKVLTDTTDGPTQQFANAFQYDAQGRVVLAAQPSALTTNASGAGPAVMVDPGGSKWYFAANTGLETLTDYYGPDTQTPGYEEDTQLRPGYSGLAVLQKTETYATYSSGGITVHPLASTEVYRNAYGTGGETTTYAYTWQGSTVREQSEVITYPVVTANGSGFPNPAGENGEGHADIETLFFDSGGRTIWKKDAGGYIQYTEYDPATGAVVKTIDDANTADTGDFANLPAGWTTAPGGGLELITLTTVDGLGRPTAVTDPNGNKTTTLYVDTAALQEVVTTPPAISGGNNPPVSVTRDDRATGDVYTFTVQSGSTQVASMSQSHFNAQGQLSYSKQFFKLAFVSYQLPTSSTAPGTLSINPLYAEWYRTDYGYDIMGRQNRVAQDIGISPLNDTSPLTSPQITRTVYDALGRDSSVWTGTSDSDWVSPGQPGSNMVEISSNQYDNGGVGDGNLTQTTQYPGVGQPNRVTVTEYDWRNRPVLTESGAGAAIGTHPPITYSIYDNLGEVTEKDTYDGNGVAVSSLGYTNGVPNAPSASLLRAKVVTSYDELGRPYRAFQYSVDQNTGTVGGALVTNTFYDSRGNVIAAFAPNGQVAKSSYDGVGRLASQYTTDGGAVGNGGVPVLTWSGASGVGGDAVLEETQTQYDKDGNPTFVITYQRHHDYTGLGALGYGNARISFVGNYYDTADRLITTVNWGNNGDDGQSFLSNGAYVRPTVPPGRDASATNGCDRWLRTDYVYDINGRKGIVIDPRGIVSRTYFDGLSRTTQTTDAYTNYSGNPLTLNMDPTQDPIPTYDTNRQTTYQYNGANEVTRQQAITYNPKTPSQPTYQDTYYDYGVTATPGRIAINSNTLLNQVQYSFVPDDSAANLPPATALANGSVSDVQQVTGYDALGEVTEQIMRDGTTHDYTFDALGRQTVDAWTNTASFSSGLISGWANEKTVAYDALGRGVRFTMLNGSTVANDVYRQYDGLSNLIAEYQAHTGSVFTSGGTIDPTVPVVQYTYETNFTNNYSRQTETIYPDKTPTTAGRVVAYAYGYDTYPLAGTATGNFLASLNAAISRIGYVVDTTTDGSELEDYDYLGLNTVVTRDRPNQPGQVRQSYISTNYYVNNPNGQAFGAQIASFNGQDRSGQSYPTYDDGGSQDPYDGLDRFGRVVDQGWSLLLDRSFAYDADGNLLYSLTETSAVYDTWKSEIYHLPGATNTPGMSENDQYDNLNRQKGYNRGVMNADEVSVDQGQGPQGPVLVTPGQTVPTQYLSVDEWSPNVNTGDYTQTQGVQNSDFPTSHVYQKPLPSSNADYSLGSTNNLFERDTFLTFDAWGELTNQSQAYLMGTGGGQYYFANSYQNVYAYDALGRRISETATDRNGNVQTTDLYYDAAGHVIQENQSSPGQSSAVLDQYVWSPVQSGMMILRDANDGGGGGLYGNPNSNLDQRVWVMQGPDGSVWALKDQGTGTAHGYDEEYVYDPAGQPTIIHWDPTLYDNTGGFDFGIHSTYDWRYLWKDGRSGRDQISRDQDPTDQSSYVEVFDGLLLMPNGSVYDTDASTQAPIQTDKYAFFRNGGGSSDMNQYQYGTRSFVNTTFGYNGTTSNTQDMMLQRDLELLKSGFDEMLTFGTTFVSSVAQEVGGAVHGVVNALSHPITTYNNVVNQTANVMARTMGAMDSLGMNSSDSAAYGFIAGAGYLVGNATGLTGIAEGIYGQDFASGQNLSTEQRWVRGMSGLSSLAFMGAGALGAAERLPSAGPRGALLSEESTEAVESATSSQPRSVSLELHPESEGTKQATQELLDAMGENETCTTSCFVAGTPVLIGVNGNRVSPPVAAALAFAGHGPDGLSPAARRDIGLGLVVLGVYGAWFIQRVQSVLLLKRAQDELRDYEPIEFPLRPRTRQRNAHADRRRAVVPNLFSLVPIA